MYAPPAVELPKTTQHDGIWALDLIVRDKQNFRIQHVAILLFREDTLLQCLVAETGTASVKYTKLLLQVGTSLKGNLR